MEAKKPKIRVGRSKMSEVKTIEALEKKSKGHITWGPDDLYPQWLVSLRQDNAVHGGIINQKVVFMSSAGVEITGMDELVEDIERAIPDVCDDFETFNGFSLMFKRVGESWKVEHVDFENVRISEKSKFFELSDDWSVKSQSLEKTNHREVPCISTIQLTATEDAPKEYLLYCKVKPKQRLLKNGKASLCNYPTPFYVSAITSILAGIEQDFFTYAETINGYKGGTLVSMNDGTPDTDEEADEIADGIKEQASDRNKGGGITVVFANGQENAATVENLNGNDLDKRYIESGKEIRNKILIGHAAGSPTLFAVNSESMFGSKEEMETAYTLLSNNYIKKRQKFIADGILWAVHKIGKTQASLTFKNYVLSMSQEADDDNRTLRQLNSMSPLVATKVLDSMSLDEIRQLAKLQPKGAAMSAEVSEIAVMVAMGKCGVTRDSVNVIRSRTYDMQSTDEDFLKEVETFATLSPIQKKIVQLIGEGKSFSEVSKAVGKGAMGLSLEIAKLTAAGVIRGWKVVKPELVNLKVLYSYEVRNGMGASVIEGTRDFCREMIALDKLYTRTEIDAISDMFGMDVWRYRGGWYHNPKTGKNTPSCRHEWKQNVVNSK